MLKLEFSDTLICEKKVDDVRAHTVLYPKNGSQIEIVSFLQLLIKMLIYSILDHIDLRNLVHLVIWLILVINGHAFAFKSKMFVILQYLTN